MELKNLVIYLLHIHFNRIFALIIAIFVIYNNIKAQSSSEIYDYIEEYKNIALQQEKKYGIPAPITLAQGIIESGAGKSTLATIANNHFGIKAYGNWDGDIFMAWDDEEKKSSFRKYSIVTDSYEDHSLFLLNNNRYKDLFANSIYDYRAWAIGLQKKGYATAKHYARAIIGYIDAYKLYSINGGVKLHPGKRVIIKDTLSINKDITIFDDNIKETCSTDEEIEIKRIINKFVVEINNVRCTILHPGETLSLISQKYNIPKYKILEYNEISNESNLNEGDIIYLQKKKKKYYGIQDFYFVKESDSIYSISQKFGIQIEYLAKMNNKCLFSRLHIGEKIRIK